MKFLSIFLVFFCLYNCAVLTVDRNLTSVLLSPAGVSLGATPIVINAPILPNMEILYIEGTVELTNEARGASEVAYNINFGVNGVPTIFPTRDIVFVVGSEEASLVSVSLTIMRMGMQLYTVNGALLKSGSISEGDFLTQTEIYESGQLVGSLPLTLEIMASSFQVKPDPMARVVGLVSWI